MKSVKKLFALLLVAVLAIGVAGCGTGFKGLSSDSVIVTYSMGIT